MRSERTANKRADQDMHNLEKQDDRYCTLSGHTAFPFVIDGLEPVLITPACLWQLKSGTGLIAANKACASLIG